MNKSSPDDQWHALPRRLRARGDYFLSREKRGDAELLYDAATEIEALREVIPLHEVGSAFAHRLAVMLECALLDRPGTWNDGHALLDEYRAACRVAGPDQEPPTFMGEPVIAPNRRAR